MRFWENNWQLKGGWERLLLDNLGGVCRTVFGWRDRTEFTAIAFGLRHNGLEILAIGGPSRTLRPVEFVVGQIDGTGGRRVRRTAPYGVGNYSGAVHGPRLFCR